jgi:hypothetical protein
LQPDGKLKVSQTLTGTDVPAILKEATYLQLSDVASLDVFPTESPDKPTPVKGVLLRKGERIVAEVDRDIVSSWPKREMNSV